MTLRHSFTSHQRFVEKDLVSHRVNHFVFRVSVVVGGKKKCLIFDICRLTRETDIKWMTTRADSKLKPQVSCVSGQLMVEIEWFFSGELTLNSEFISTELKSSSETTWAEVNLSRDFTFSFQFYSLKSLFLSKTWLPLIWERNPWNPSPYPHPTAMQLSIIHRQSFALASSL